MKSLRTIITDAALLVFLGAGLGLTANQARNSGHIEPLENAFERRVHHPPVPVASTLPPSAIMQGQAIPGAPPAPAIPTAKAFEHPYQVISFDDLSALFADPDTADGIAVFIDARRPDAFAQGHVPGARQCYPFDAHLCRDWIEADVKPAQKVVVYCGGGQCEDSAQMCEELIGEFEIPFDNVYLYAGGWAEWTKNNMPVEYGE